MLLQVYSEQCRTTERIYTELAKKINTRVDRVLNKAKYVGYI